MSIFSLLKASKKSQRNFLSSSEFVSSGHPDRLADNLAAIVIQDIQRVDGHNSHAAIEVFITHDSIIFGGEATTSLEIDRKYLRQVVAKGFQRSGYIKEISNYWSKSECLLPSDFNIVNKICAQSEDIALGTTDKGSESGWNDQGVYFSSADNTTANRLGTPQFFAQIIGEELQKASRDSILSGGEETNGVILGPDNKCVVTCRVSEDGFTPLEITAITVAVAHASCSSIESVREFVQYLVTEIFILNDVTIAEDCVWVINGTGRFVVHGPISDTSMTGRKISVNHPSAGPVWANKMIGGGSLVKPAHASDLILNVMSRFIANVVVAAGYSSYAVVGCAGAIGVHGVQSLFIKGDNKFENSKIKDLVEKYFAENIKWAPIAIAEKFGFFSETFDFGVVVNSNFFGHGRVQPWDNEELIRSEVEKLSSYIKG